MLSIPALSIPVALMLAAFPALLLEGAAAHAATADDLAFGLGRLHWNMTPQEAHGVFPALDGVPPEPGQPSVQFSLPDFSIAGCSFGAKLDFERGHLQRVELDSNGAAHLKSCGPKIRAVLLHQYGGEPGGFSTAPNPHGYSIYATWGGPVTEIMYAELRDAFIEVSFSRTPGR
jgi:hypothetical protein